MVKKLDGLFQWIWEWQEIELLYYVGNVASADVINLHLFLYVIIKCKCESGKILSIVCTSNNYINLKT